MNKTVENKLQNLNYTFIRCLIIFERDFSNPIWSVYDLNNLIFQK